ncbi:N-acetylglutamate synthase, CG3035 family [Rhodococcus triatomae]
MSDAPSQGGRHHRRTKDLPNREDTPGTAPEAATPRAVDDETAGTASDSATVAIPTAATRAAATPRPGSRVVMRYKLPPGYPQPLTDIIGELVGLSPAVVVRAQDGRVVQVAPDQVVALKSLGARPVATREIRALELAAADGWPGTEQAWINGWLVRAADGFTRRANAAAPLGNAQRLGDLHSGDTLDRLRAWFAERGQPLTLMLPDRLGAAPAGWTCSPEVQVMAADIGNLTLPDGESMVTVTDSPEPQWLATYHYRGAPLPDSAAPALAAVSEGEVAFGALGGPGAGVLAIARAAVTEAPDGRRWVGLSAVEVAPPHRRRGLGMLICAEMIRWGRDRGATHTYVQVEADNAGAIALYRTLGLVDHHRYRYATAPAT